ncbi:hypothetical protein [Hirschia litorea]|uniref:Uncharacterized protein n=1 Tax=Hirschia litorea TaxID=1199156 RepID=A0ABW2INZ0_9PROT
MDDPILEAVYYSHPFPRSSEALTLLGLIFDKIHFPYVSLPDEGYSFEELDERRAKLINLFEKEAHKPIGQNTLTMIIALDFTHWKQWANEFLYFPHSFKDSLKVGESIPAGATEEVYNLTFPPRKNFEPYFDTFRTFSVSPEPRQSDSGNIIYPGDYVYSAAALNYAAQKGLPIINDEPMLGMPKLDAGSLKHNTSALASALAVECIQFVLPSIPKLDFSELLDFRDEMKPHVKRFRLAILRMAKTLSQHIEDGAEAEAISNAAKFIVETEVQPLLIELREFAESENRPWHKQLILPLRNLLRPQFWMMPEQAALAQLGDKYFSLLTDHELSVTEKDKQLRRSPMYYLLEMQKLSR